MWLTLLALRNRIGILMLSLAMVILGATSLERLPVDLFPNIQVPVAFVGVIYKGAPPLDIEQSVVYPIEKAVSSASNVEHVESFAKQGIGAVQVWFNWGADINVGQMEVMQRITQILNSLPPGILQPFIVKFDVSNIPVAFVTASGGDLDERALYDLAYNTIAPQIEQISNVAAATVEGGKIRQININLDPALLQARGLSILDVVKAVKASNLILPSGDIKAGNLDYNVFTNTQFKTVEPINDVVVKIDQRGNPVRVRDVGVLSDSSDIQTNVVRTDGKRSVYLRVNKQPIANTVEVVDALRKAIPKMIGIPPGVQLGISFDQSIYIRQSIKNLIEQALHGSLLAAAVILLFLRNLTSTLIISVAIPLSILVTFIVLYFTNQTLNVFTMGGLALGIGRLVDDSIVELENIQRHLNVDRNRWDAIVNAAREVAMPIFASTVTTVVVFLPMFFIVGIARLLLIPLTLTIAIALFTSFFVSRTVTPALCYRFLKSEQEAHRSLPSWFVSIMQWSQRRYDALDEGYERSLRWVLTHRRTLLVSVVTIFVGSLMLLPFIGTEFLPVSDESQFRIVLRGPVGQRVEKTVDQVAEVERVLREKIPPDELEAIASSTGVLAQGRSSLFNPNTGPHTSVISVYLSSPDKRRRNQVEIMNAVRPAILKLFPGVAMFFDPGGLVKRVTSFGSQKSIDVEIYGYDFEKARTVIHQVQDLMHKIPGMADIEVSREENYPEVNVVVDREKAALLGISETDVANAVLFSLNGNGQTDPIIFTDPQNGNEYYISAWLAEEHRKDLSAIENVLLTTKNGEPVLLKNLATLKLNAGPVKIERKYFQRVVHITANPVGRDLGSIAQDLESAFAQMQLPPGFSIRLAGQIQQQRETFEGLTYASVLALILVYMVMAAQFKSLIDPFIIMFSVPMGIPGVIVILYLTNTTISTSSLMGIIMMLGIVVSNGVLLVDYTNVLRRRGLDLATAVVTASRTRLRPILMTSLATVVGLMPMALGLGTGSETNAPLARAVVGGLTVSTILTLFLVPTVYTMLEERFPRRADQLGEERVQSELVSQQA
ncbi:MAG: efflux RND transporter permease subunit [Nitrospira sp.]|jgi:CzcA family heavy metal efflux pump|uniref:efflux RND transporter permease subunit n=1 Tax=Nitrospira sp. ND1 TaxID=1658518 RepID=UPI0009BBE027|nr:efflux RND transporter permease subunit [Nitrospira sp. ND1]MBK7418910.1 efflux RND transporter permease subunit [Nitrospira sp.]MBK9998940.1 efflux RND transporter permease subunit [Nitrospira sp.]MBP6200949.1 efflux RND transporter permease subunit [Nitrospira sp.]MBP7361484.1 efflux RND transporter permease subunit [Nitrospira sp.]MBP8103774.1 efflux RND transporter permease subunit [Nitrospira sp.]